MCPWHRIPSPQSNTWATPLQLLPWLLRSRRCLEQARFQDRGTDVEPWEGTGHKKDIPKPIQTTAWERQINMLLAESGIHMNSCRFSGTHQPSITIRFPHCWYLTDMLDRWSIVIQGQLMLVGDCYPLKKVALDPPVAETTMDIPWMAPNHLKRMDTIGYLSLLRLPSLRYLFAIANQDGSHGIAIGSHGGSINRVRLLYLCCAGQWLGTLSQ